MLRRTQSTRERAEIGEKHVEKEKGTTRRRSKKDRINENAQKLREGGVVQIANKCQSSNFRNVWGTEKGALKGWQNL